MSSRRDAWLRVLDAPWHPALVALYPLLALFAFNESELFLTELPEPAGLALAGTLLAWALFALPFGARRGAIVASIAAALFFSYGHVVLAVARARIEHPWLSDRYVDPVWGAAFLAALVVAWVLRKRPVKVTRALNVVALFLVAMPAAQIVAYEVGDRTWTAPEASASIAGAGAAEPPNVYFVMLDGYAHEETLLDVYGYDNGQFLDALRARGFYVVPESRSNYAMTTLSLPSMLNLRYLEGLPPDSTDRTVAHEMVRRSDLARFFREHGYRYVHFNSGFGPTTYEVEADWTVECGRLTEFQRALVTTTPIMLFAPDIIASQDRERTLCQLELLEEMPGTEGPFFVFAHILAPHPPYLFDADGGIVDPGDPVADGLIQSPAEQGRKQEMYVAQLQYTNTRVLGLVDGILAREARPPVIVFMSDHGPDSLEVTLADWSDPSPEFLMERLRNFEAVHLPPEADRSLLYETMTPVNVLRVVLDAEFGTSLGRLEDRSWFSTYERPFDWRDVTEQVDFEP